MSQAGRLLVVDIRRARRIVSDAIHSTCWCRVNEGVSVLRPIVASTENAFCSRGHQ